MQIDYIFSRFSSILKYSIDKKINFKKNIYRTQEIYSMNPLSQATIALGLEYIHDPKNREEIAKSLIKENKLQFTLPNSSNTTLTIKPVNKQFRSNLKSMRNALKNHTISELDKKKLVEKFIQQINRHRADYALINRVTKTKRLFFAPTRDKKYIELKAAKHETEILSEEVLKNISHQAKLALAEISIEIKKLEERVQEKALPYFNSETLVKETEPTEAASTSKEVAIQSQAQNAKPETRKAAREYTTEETTHLKLDQKIKQQKELLTKIISILQTDENRQELRRKNLLS
jgi:hypothetical protein